MGIMVTTARDMRPSAKPASASRLVLLAFLARLALLCFLVLLTIRTLGWRWRCGWRRAPGWRRTRMALALRLATHPQMSLALRVALNVDELRLQSPDSVCDSLEARTPSTNIRFDQSPTCTRARFGASGTRLATHRKHSAAAWGAIVRHHCIRA